MTWLDDLKPGDKVFVRHSHIEDHTKTEVVSKVTATQIVVGNERFRRNSGRKCGQSDPWSGRVYLKQYDAACEAKLIKARARSSTIGRLLNLRRDDLQKLTDSQLARIVAILDELKDGANQ